MDLILNNMTEPTYTEIENYIEGNARNNWTDINSYLKEKYNSKPSVMYSKCSAKPGWNIKYKYKSKSLCTLYPEKDKFVALIVLGDSDREIFDVVRVDFTDYIKNLYDKCALFNNTKWLMIDVTDNNILSDVKRLIEIKIH